MKNLRRAITATADEINRACDTSSRIVNLTASTLSVTEATHDGKVITINRAAGTTITLPAATGSGATFRFVVGTTITSNTGVIQVANASDIMTGTAFFSADTGASVVGWETAGDTDTITFDGTTTGGYKGDFVEIIDIASNLFFVKILGSATGTEATPFSAAVS